MLKYKLREVFLSNVSLSISINNYQLYAAHVAVF